MKKRTSFKYKNIYVFIIILSLIGFISGYKYYDIQEEDIKTSAISSLNIKENLKKPINNILKNGKKSLKPIIYSAIIITQPISIINIFYEPFQIGFVFNLLNTYNIKFSMIYIFTYHLIPLIILLFLIKVSFTISKYLIKFIIWKNINDKKHLLLIIKKYFIILSFELIYDIVILFFSSNINSYLISII